MIKANEIRCGNLVVYVNDGRLFKIYEIDQSGIRVINEDEDTWMEYENFEGVELTPAILERCGFEYKGGDGYVLPNGFSVYVSLRNGWMVGDSKHIPQIKGFEYLHQLQNLYHALTHEELTLKN